MLANGTETSKFEGVLSETLKSNSKNLFENEFVSGIFSIIVKELEAIGTYY
jgi:hypothetical protein